MRLAFVASTLALGGAERITGEVSQRLAARGHEVVWLLLREAGPEGERLRRRGLRVETGVGGWKFDPRTPGRLAARLVEGGIEAAWCLDHQNAAVALALAARRIPAVRRLFLAVHTTGLWGGGPSIPRGVRAVLPSFTRVVAVADAQRRYLIEQLAIPAAQLVVVRNGIDVEAFTATRERMARAANIRHVWLDGAEAPVIGVVAALRPEKGHADLLAAIMAGNGRLRAAHLVFVGEGPERNALERQATASGLGGRVHLLGARTDIAELLPAFDVVVLPSRPFVETLPLSVMEAMAAGRPVLATRVGALDELIEDGVNGRLVPPEDGEALSAALEELLGDPTRAAELGRQAALRAREFDLEQTVAATAQLFSGTAAGLV